jgi:hypothetical protein
MKKSILLLAIVAATATASGQAKVKLLNSSNSPFTLTSDTGRLFPEDINLASQPIPTTGPLPSGRTLVVGLYEGLTSDSLSLANVIGGTGINPVAINPSSGGFPRDGIANPQNLVIDNTPTRRICFFQLKVWDAIYPTFELALIATGGQDYFGENNVWSMAPLGGLAYDDLRVFGGSTWTAVGNESPVIVAIAPEPGSLALAGFGGATLLIFCHRKHLGRTRDPLAHRIESS